MKIASDLSHAYVRINNRLALYRSESPGVFFWEDNWAKISDEILNHALRPTKRLGIHRSFFKRWLPKNGVILEAGCGTGLWVIRLRQNGWHCIGIDSAKESLCRAKRVNHSLPVACSDLRSLPFADDSISAYLSLGVVEHLQVGPLPFLKECWRVLRDDGVALISVPFENRFRKNIPTITESEALTRGLKFYQYYFTLDGFNHELDLAGLQPTNYFHGYSVNAGLAESAVFLKSVARSLGRFSILLDLMPGLPKLTSHMMSTVAIKTLRAK